MSSLIAMRLRLEPGQIRPALLNPVGLCMLSISVLVLLAIYAARGADEWLDIAYLLPLVGLLGYAATVLAYLFVEDWPADPGLWQLLAIRDSMRSKHRQLRSDRMHIGRDALLPEVAEAARKMDRQIVPDYRRIVIRRDRLDAELRRYAEGVLPAPSAVLLNRLRRIATERQQALAGIIAHAANADAVLLQLLEIDDTAECVERAAFWQADLQDIQEALAEVLAGYDPFETAVGLLEPGASAASRLASLSDLPAEAPTASARISVETPPVRSTYPDGLTGREVEVLALMADGRKSKEIAEALVISVATVNRHILNIYGKIDARGRADATRYALRHSIRWPIDGSYGGVGASQPSPSASGRHGDPAVAVLPSTDKTTLELRVLLLLSEGKSHRQVSEELGISLDQVTSCVAAVRVRMSDGRRKP